MTLELAAMPADSAAVEAEAMAWRQHVGTVDASGKATTNAFVTVLNSWFGSLYDFVSAAPQPIATEAERVRGELLYNAGVLDLWADALQVLAETRAALISQFDNAGPDYGAETVDIDDVEPDNVGQVKEDNAAAIQTAKANLQTSLTQQYTLAVGDLDEAAIQVAALMQQGATPDNLRFLFERGSIPRGDVPFFAGWIHIFDLDQGLPPELEGKTAAEIEALILANPDIAKWVMDNRPGTHSADPAERALAEAMNFPSHDPESKMDEIRRVWDSLSPEDQARMVVLFPGVVGNLNGVPFADRGRSNQIAITHAQNGEKENLADLQEQLADLERLPKSPMNDPNQAEKEALQAQIDASEGLLDRYDEFVGNTKVPQATILYFEPGPGGGVVALNGSIDGDTRHVGVLVPGTGSDLGGSGAPIRTSDSFVQANGNEDLAMVTWMGSPLPPDLSSAIDSQYSVDAAHPLAEFSYALEQEIGANAEGVSGQDVDVTTIGHSYGGAVVGNAQAVGLHTDKVVHVASAGLGVWNQQIGSVEPGSTYTMTAPGDPIGHAQGNPLGQGPDPTTLPGATQLETGNYPVDHADPSKAGQPVEGQDAHGDIIDTPGTGSWWNIYGVLTDGPLDVIQVNPEPTGESAPTVPVPTPPPPPPR